MGYYRFTAHADAPREEVFDLWVNLDRAPEWIEGLTGITDVTGPFDQAGTRYSAWFGRMKTPSEVIAAERPHLVRTRFANTMLRGTTQATFEDEDRGTRITEEFWTDGLIPAIVARIFATGSYRGSFRGELNAFVRLAEREAAEKHNRKSGL